MARPCSPVCVSAVQDGQEFMKLLLTMLEHHFSRQADLKDVIPVSGAAAAGGGSQAIYPGLGAGNCANCAPESLTY